MTYTSPLAAAISAALIALGAPLAAQSADTPVAPAKIEAADVTDTQIEAFVDAVMAVEEVRMAYGPKIQNEEDADVRETLAKEASVAAQKAIENIGDITTAQYLGIGQAASGDQDLNQRILAELKERREETQKGDATTGDDNAATEGDAGTDEGTDTN